MIYILAWLICGICSFYLLKAFLHRITEEQAGLFHCIQELFEQMDKEEIEKLLEFVLDKPKGEIN